MIEENGLRLRGLSQAPWEVHRGDSLRSVIFSANFISPIPGKGPALIQDVLGVVVVTTTHHASEDGPEEVAARTRAAWPRRSL